MIARPPMPEREAARRKDLLIFTAVSLLVLLPNAVLLWRSPSTVFAIDAVVKALLLWLWFTISLGTARRALWLALPFLLLLPAEAYFVYMYGYPTSKYIVAVIAETHPREVTELLSGIAVWLALVLAVLCTLWYALFRAASRVPLWPGRVRIAVFLCGVLALGAIEGARRMGAESYAIRSFTLAPAYPIGVPVRVLGHAKIYLQSREARAQIAGHQFGASTRAERMTVVLVIGESSRPDHWSINGYARETTPRLARREHLYFMRDLVSPWTLTLYSVPLIIKRKPAAQTAIFSERSILAAFAEAGFKTFFLTNQEGLLELDLHAGEAAVRGLYNFAAGRSDADEVNDERMLPDLKQHILDDPAPRKLLVVHSKGSHWDYHLRYPDAYRKFVPDQSASATGKHDPSQAPALRNAYDNSIAYTDFFLDEIIGYLTAAREPAALIYVSDHGELLYDEGCPMWGHGNDSEINFRTAGFVWLSPALARARPELPKALATTSTRRLTTEGIVFATLADLGELSIADTSLSLLNPALTPPVRLVQTSQGAVDFDRAPRSGVCRIVGRGGQPRDPSQE